MKKIFVLLLVVAFSFAGCNFQLPKSVSIRTKADYNFAVAKIDKDLSEYLSSEKLAENFSSSENDVFEVQMFDYWPDMDGEMQQYLMRIPVKSIPVDLDSYFGDMQVSSDVKNMSFNQEIKVPNLNETVIEETVNMPLSGVLAPLASTPVGPLNINLGTVLPGDDCEELTISEGTLTLEIVTEGWTGTHVAWNNVSLSGGINIDNSGFSSAGEKRVANLNGVKITKDKTTANISISLSADRADFSKMPKIKVTFNITKIASIKSKLPEGTKTKVELNEPFEIDDAVDKIVLGDSELVCTYYNTMPAGNDYTLTCESDFLNIPSQESAPKLMSNISKEKTEKITFKADNGEEGKTVERDASGVFPNVDLNTSFGFGDEDGYVIAKNVEPGKTYELGVDVEINIVWISVDINMSRKSVTSENPSEEIIDLGFDFSSIFDSVEDLLGNGDDSDDFFSAFSIKSIPIYVYCQMPDLDAFKDCEFRGNITIGKKVTDENGDERFEPHMENGDEKKFFETDEIEKASIPKLEKQGNIVITDIAKQEYSGTSDLAEILTSETKGAIAFRIDDIEFSTGESKIITITKAEMDELKNNSDDEATYNIEIRSYIVLPLEFNVGHPDDPNGKIYYYTLMDIGGESDLFGRSGASEDEQIETYLSAIKSARIGFNSPQLPLECTPSNPAVYIKFGIPDAEEKKISISADEYFSISGDEISDMLKTYPLKTTVRMGFQKGSFCLNRSLKFSTVINLGLTTDGTIPLFDLRGDN